MNWTEIKEKCPKAHRTMGMWLSFNERYSEFNHSDRVLFDFFDEQGIRTNVYYIKGSFYWEIDTVYEFEIVGNDTEYNYRTEAEEEAFTKAFEILEEKLK